jgi:hypothetical protein
LTKLLYADYSIEQRKHSNALLNKIDQFIGWNYIENLLKRKYKKTMSADGEPAYAPC